MSLEFDYPRDFKGIFIPKEIWLDDDLSAIDKIILSEIYSLDVEDSEGCYASNEYLSKFCKCSVTKVSTSISNLINLGYVRIAKSDGRKRFLKVSLSKFESQTIKKRKSAYQKVKQSNIDNNIDNEYSINSPTELHTNEFASSPTGLHTSLSDERKARGKSKDKWVVTKNHIVSVMDKLGYGELADETQSAIEVFRYYYMMYKQKTGKAHPRLNDKAMTDTLVNFIDSLSEIDCIDCDDYECMIDEHFSNNYGKEIDWSIRHFMNIGILKKLYKRLIY